MGDDARATFVFKGTVTRVKATTLAHLPANASTHVVRVDDIIEAPRALAQLSGHAITVRLGRSRRLTVGRTMIFHAHGWIFGDTVAVESVREEPVRGEHVAMLARGGDPVEHRRQRELRDRFAQAHVVVSGRVRAVRLPATARASGARLVRAAADRPRTPLRPVSEHDPHWREALIDVEHVHKGTHSSREIVVRFPASIDVRWYKAPKFEPGQQGTFLVRETPVPAESRRRARPAGARATAAPLAGRTTTRVYTALSPMDFQPDDRPGGIHALIQLRRSTNR